MGGNLNLDGQLTGAQHLHGLVLANGALLNECLDGDNATFGEELVQLVQVYNLELNAERVLEATQLRQAHVQRQLAAGKASLNLVASLGTLGTATSGLTLGSFTTANTGFSRLGTRCGTQVVDLQCVLLFSSFSSLLRPLYFVSSTLIRCGTVLTMPTVTASAVRTTV